MNTFKRFTKSSLIVFLMTNTLSIASTILNGSIEEETTIENTISNTNGGVYNNTAVSTGGTVGTNNLDVHANFKNNSTTAGHGGVLANIGNSPTNNAILGSVKGFFEGNQASGNGGAIYNSSNANILKIEGNFTGNKGVDGGAIYNDGEISFLTGNFVGNEANGNGGAIYSSGSVMITGNSLFEGNLANGESNAIHAADNAHVQLAPFDTEVITFNDALSGTENSKITIGGAITKPKTDANGEIVYKNDGNGNFTDANGDVIYTDNKDGSYSSTTEFNQIHYEKDTVNGGYIQTTTRPDGSTSSENVTTVPDSAENNKDQSYTTERTVISYYKKVNGEYIVTDSTGTGEYGNIGTSFFGDYKHEDVDGGYYTSRVITGDDTLYTVTVYEKKLYTLQDDGTYKYQYVTVNPTTGAVETVTGQDNPNDNPLSGTTVTDNQDQTYSDEKAVIYQDGTLTGLIVETEAIVADGTVVFNKDLSNVLSDIEIGTAGTPDEDGDENTLTIVIGPDMGKDEATGDTNFFGGKVTVNDDFILDMMNSVDDQINLEKWETVDDAKIMAKVEVTVTTDTDGTKVTGDKFTNVNGQNIDITDVKITLENSLVSDLDGEKIVFGDGDNIDNISMSASSAEVWDPIHITDIELVPTTGTDDVSGKDEYFVQFPEIEEETPEVPDVTPDENAPGNDNSTPEKPDGNINTPSDFNPDILKTSVALGAYASTLEGITDRILNKRKEEYYSNSVWFDTYGSDEEIKYSTKYGEKRFDNEVYITTAGFDYEYDRIQGVDESNSIYFGYLNSTQNYENVEFNQEGFYLGTAFELVKQNKYLNFTILGGRVKVEEDKSGDNFDMYSLSTALKLGVQHLVSDDIIIEPSLSIAYHNFMSEDYTTSSNVDISTETTNIFNFTPEIKITKNMKMAKPYIVLSYNYNYYIGGEITGTLKETTIELPNVEVKNYVEARIGVDKVFNETLKTYAEIIGTRGDKDSIGGQIGIEYKF